LTNLRASQPRSQPPRRGPGARAAAFPPAAASALRFIMLDCFRVLRHCTSLHLIISVCFGIAPRYTWLFPCASALHFITFDDFRALLRHAVSFPTLPRCARRRLPACSLFGAALHYAWLFPCASALLRVLAARTNWTLPCHFSVFCRDSFPFMFQTGYLHIKYVICLFYSFLS
jgi:hypothetical protein